MIKKNMYFYDKKQAKVISKINDKLHKKRGVVVIDNDYKPLGPLNALSEINNINKGDDKHINNFVRKVEKMLTSITNDDSRKKAYSAIQSESKTIKMYMNAKISEYKRIISLCDDLIDRA